MTVKGEEACLQNQVKEVKENEFCEDGGNGHRPVNLESLLVPYYGKLVLNR